MKVKIKTWDAMVKEFGLNVEGEINCDKPFNSLMEKTLPKDRVVEMAHDKWDGWEISYDMVDHSGFESVTFDGVDQMPGPDPITGIGDLLADEHWSYVKSLLVAHGADDDSLSVIKFHYKSAFVHGFKHGAESVKESHVGN